MPTPSHFENMTRTSDGDVNVSDAMRKCNSLEEVVDFLPMVRQGAEFAGDDRRCVLKVDALSQQRNLGATSSFPMVYCLPSSALEQAVTRLESVSYQVGRTGRSRPWLTWSRCCCRGRPLSEPPYNEDAIEALDLHIGDMVYVEREDYTEDHGSGYRSPLFVG